MAITQPRHGRWLLRCLAVALLLLGAGIVAPAQDRFGSRVIRGQSPIGNYYRYPQRYPQCVQSDRPLPFTAAASPWIMVSQDLQAPPQALGAEPTNMMNQQRHDPSVQQPFSGGVPGYVDPSLAWGFMNTPPIWQPYVGVQGNLGNDRLMGFGQLMIPLYQDGQSLIFADLRGRFDDSSNSEGNFGLAVRTMVDPTWIYGLYGFYDHKRTEFGNSFQQATFGVEALSVSYEARVNGYIPESGAKRANQITTAQFDETASTIFVRGGFERAYYGVDAEVGALLSEGYGGNAELRGFVGGYYYDTTASGFPVVAGPKGRLELRAYDVPSFGPESRLTLGVELQHDSVRDTQVAGIARLEIPLGFFGGARRLNRLERRMLDRIVRDDDIITVAQKSPREVGRDSLTGRLLDNVTWVDADTVNMPGGVPGVVAKSGMGVNSTVVVDGKAGVIQSNNIVVQKGQVFRGGGFQVIGQDTGAMTTFGTRPTINNNSPPDMLTDTVILSNDPTVLNPEHTAGADLDRTAVADLDLTGGLNGISGTNLDNVLVSGNKVSGAEIFGIGFNGTLTSSTVSGNTTNDNGFAGIGIENMAAGSTASGNTANNNSFAGIYIGEMSGGTVSGNTANDNGDVGMFVGNMAANSAVSGNRANNNFGFGFNFDGGIEGLVSENIANNNALSGYLFNSTILGLGTVSGNFATANGFSSDALANDSNANGFSLISGNFGTFTNNTANQNGGQGYLGLNFGTAVNNTGNGNVGGGNTFNFP